MGLYKNVSTVAVYDYNKWIKLTSSLYILAALGTRRDGSFFVHIQNELNLQFKFAFADAASVSCFCIKFYKKKFENTVYSINSFTHTLLINPLLFPSKRAHTHTYTQTLTLVLFYFNICVVVSYIIFSLYITGKANSKCVRQMKTAFSERTVKPT